MNAIHVIIYLCVGVFFLGAIHSSTSYPCYSGESLPIPGGSQDSPDGLPVCIAGDASGFTGRALYQGGRFSYVGTTRRRFSIGNPSSPSTILMYLLSMGQIPSPGFVSILNTTNPELVCGSCVCILCGNTTVGPPGNTTTVVTPPTNPNVTLTPSIYRGGPWFPYSNGSLPLDTPPGWNISNTDRHLSEYCTMPASPYIANADDIVIGLNNLSICGGCVRLRYIPDVINLGSGDPCLKTWHGQSWDYQLPPMWTVPDLTYPNCSIYPRYRWVSAGWFDGYSSEAICVARSNAIPFGCKPVGTGYAAQDKWCPTLSQTLDPVVCNRSGVVDRACTAQFYNGQSVNGDTLFCAQYGCNTNSQCICSFVDIADIEEMFVNGSWTTGATISISMSVETSESNHIRPRMPSFEMEEEQMFLSTYDDVIKIVFVTAADRTISLSKPGMSDWFQCQTKVCTRNLQDATFLSSGFIRVISISTVNKTAVGETWVVGKSSCYRYDCTFCPEDLQNFDCLDTSYKIVVVMGGICLILVAILLCMIILFYGAWLLMWLARKFGNCFFNTPIGDRSSSGVRNFFNLFVPRNGMQHMALLMLFCLCADACDTTYIQQTNLTNCVQDVSGLFESCEMSVDIQVTLPYLGSTACLTLSDESGKVITSMEIHYERARMELDYALQYFTSSYKVETEEKLRCSAKVFSSGCDVPTCAHGNVTRDGNGNLNKVEAVMYPGMTFCDVAFAGSTLEPWPACLFGNDCFYSAYGINPQGVVYSVSKLVQERLSSVILLNFTGGDGVMEAELSFDKNPNLIYGDYTISLSSSAVPNKLALDSLYLVNSVSNDTAFKSFLTEASSVNQPVSGTVGDIQANVASLLTGERVPTQGEIAYDPSLVMSRIFNDRTGGVAQVDWTFRRPGIENLVRNTGAELPGSYNGVPIKFLSDNVLWYPLDLTPSAVLSMSGPSVVISRSISSVCPTFEILEAGGCRSCSKGANIVISAKSSCLPGTAVVSTKSDDVSIITPIVYLSDDFTNATIKVKTNESEITVDLCLESTTVECHSVTFRTLEVTSGEVINQTAQVDIHTGSNDASDSSWFMFKWLADLFEGVGTWWKSLLAILFWIGMFILLIVLLWLTFPLWWPMLMWCISSIRGMLAKLGRKIPDKQKTDLPTTASNMEVVRQEQIRRREAKKLFDWD